MSHKDDYFDGDTHDLLLYKIAQRDKVIEKCRHILSGIKLYRAFNGDDWPAREAEEALDAIEQLVGGGGR